MPQAPNPPYAPSTIQPRTLNRWLDVNSQNGSLKRTRGYIALPLDQIGEIVGPNVGIRIINNSSDFRTFRLVDIAGNVIDTMPLDASESGDFTNVVDAYGVRFTNSSSPFILPYVGWIGILTFNADHTWTSTSTFPVNEKILQFNYSSTRNFSLKADSNLRFLVQEFGSELIICITNVIGDSPYNTVVRYCLNGDFSVIDAVPYTGQQILGKYFQIEFWTYKNVNVTLEALAAALRIDTTQLGDNDYRWALDFPVSAPAVIVTNFNNTSPSSLNLFSLPITFNANTISGLN